MYVIIEVSGMAWIILVNKKHCCLELPVTGDLVSLKHGMHVDFVLTQPEKRKQ